MAVGEGSAMAVGEGSARAVPGLATMLLQSHSAPGASFPTRGGARARQGSVSSSVREAKRQPNLKVMEDSQDQHEGMNFKHVLLYFGKVETLK